MRNSDIQILLAIIDQAYEKKSWHGTNLRGSVRGLTPAEAAWRPGRTNHNIWEIVVHAAYWKYVVRRRITGELRGSFPESGSNWFKRPAESDAAAWKRDIALMDEMHQTLRSVVSSLDPGRLATKPHGSKVTIFATLTGIAAHDLYHAGQIQLLKRLERNRR